jgi:thioredoxin-dependent peroxiredoxin
MVTTAAAIVVSLVNVIAQRIDASSVELQPGDAAPDFVLPGSDGRTYRLSEFAGRLREGSGEPRRSEAESGRRAVVIAWFPKAFTGG